MDVEDLVRFCNSSRVKQFFRELVNLIAMSLNPDLMFLRALSVLADDDSPHVFEKAEHLAKMEELENNSSSEKIVNSELVRESRMEGIVDVSGRDEMEVMDGGLNEFAEWSSVLDQLQTLVLADEKFKVEGNENGEAMKTDELFGVESMEYSEKDSRVKCCSCDGFDDKDISSITSMTMEDDKLRASDGANDSTNNNGGGSADGGCSIDDDLQDLYGSRNYGLPSSRPTMISPKYRQKEERRKVVKLSLSKLKRIEDPESTLRRSVLINNTLKRLQRETKEEKAQKSQINSSLASQNKCFGLSSDFIVKQEENLKHDFVTSLSLSSRTSDQLLDITNLPDGKTCSKYGNDCLDCDEAISDLTFPGERSKARKRSIDETLDEECDVLSQCYLAPPTPRVAPSLDEDEDEDVNVVDVEPPVEPLTKKRRGNDADTFNQIPTAADRLRDNLPSTQLDEWSMDESVLLQATLQPPQSTTSPSSSPFSCGHSSMFSDFVVYHNLIATLES